MIMLFLYSIDHNHRKTSTSKIESWCRRTTLYRYLRILKWVLGDI
jgi:hypothetical protein